MKTFIFLTNYYLPEPGATGMCVHQLAKKLAQGGNEVYTICYEDKKNHNTEQTIDGVNVIKIKLPNFLKNTSKNKLKNFLNILESRLRKLVYITKYPLRSYKLVKEYVNAIEKLIDKYNNVTIIASYTPLEAVIAAYKMKNKYLNKVKIIYYSADTLSNEQGDDGLLPASFRTKSGIKWEKKLFKNFDKILIMECHQEHYMSSEYIEFKDKFEIVNFPLFTEINGIKVNNKINNTISMVYIGTLYKILRNPEKLCKWLLELSKKENIHVDFLGGGDCNDILERYCGESNRKIVYHGMQSHEVAMEYLSNANVLLSIGNEESPMAPSKIYEYMSTGKPIIHVYTYEKDPCINPLKKYGNALLINDEDEEAIDKILNYIKDLNNIDVKKVKEKFITSTPEYTIDIIKKL